MNVLRISILLAACVLLRPIAAQDEPPVVYVFSGFASLGDCDQFPAPSVSIGPSMNRSKTRDVLVIQCDQSSHKLSLTFKIDSSIPLTHGSDFRAYSFRWGAPGRSGHIVLDGQFEKERQRCLTFVDLFNAQIPQTLRSSIGPVLHSPRWSAQCNHDDAWGTSMEIYLGSDDPKSP